MQFDRPESSSLATRPWLVALLVTGCIVILAAIVIAAMQSFVVSDTKCEGVVVRVLRGGPARSVDGVCARGDSVRLRASAAVGLVALLLIAAAVVQTRRFSARLPE